MSFPQAAPSEASTIARRLAHKLDCRTIALVGAVRPALITSLPGVRLAGFDGAEHLGYAATLLPDDVWQPLETVGSTIDELDAPLAVLSFETWEALDDDTVDTVMRAVRAALLIDLDGLAGHGAEALSGQLARLRKRDVEIVRAELIAPVEGASHGRTSPAVVVSAGQDGGLEHLLGTGLNGLRLDPEVDSFTPGSRPCRLCIVSYEVVGPSRNGGIGTANTSLALALASAGHDVTLLYSGNPSEPEAQEHWRRHFADRKVSYAELDGESVASVASPHINVRRAWASYQWVRERHEVEPFDVIHAPECQGHLAFIAAAKLHGVAFEDTLLVTGVHSPTRWCFEANQQPVSGLTSLVDEHLERGATEDSDVVISPSGYMLGYLRSRGWQLPARSFVQQYITSEAIRQLSELSGVEGAVPAEPPTEIVFFGRLEMRKGIELFCDALDGLVEDPALRDVRITFLGSSVHVHGESSCKFIERRAQAWPWPIQIESEMSQPEAVAFVRDPGRLAVVPSLVDNSPNTVYEAIALGIPIIVSRSGGTAELISVDDLERCSFAGWPEDGVLDPVPAEVVRRPVNPEALGRALRAAMGARANRVRPSVDPDANEASHVSWHAALGGRARKDAKERPRREPALTTILIEVPHEGRAGSVEGDVVLAVAGDIPEGLADVAAGWKVLPVGAVTSGRPRNVAAQAATGELLLFLPGDVEPAPGLVAALRRAAGRSAADVFVFPVHDASGEVIVPIGGPPPLALAYPYFGDEGFAIRAEAFRALGGFNESADVARPATELLNRVALAGRRIDVLTEVLGRRTTPHPLRSLLRNETWAESVHWDVHPEEQLEILRPFREGAGLLADLPALYRASQELLHDTHDHARRTHAAYEELAAHAKRLQQAYDDLQAHLRRVEEFARHNSAESESKLRSELDIVYSSHSWRITAPLRKLAERFKS